MSTVFLHVGQCGNQLGQEFWEEMGAWSSLKTSNSQKRNSQQFQPKPLSTAAKTKDKPYLPYSLPDGTIPCILVDSESKVVHKCSTNSTTVLGSRLSKECVFTDKTGRGNNWAYGYNGRTVKEPVDPYRPGDLSGSVRECVRKVVERCDRFTGTVLFHSIAGGTGSGLGSALVEHLRDDYPLAYIFSVLVAPFSHGETPLQHYNSLLCLSWIQDYCDAALLFKNDSVLEQTHRQRQSSGGVARQPLRGGRSELGQGSVEDMNKHISQCLCNVFLPLWSPKQSKGCFEPLEMVRSLCPNPSTKFITPVHTNSSRPTSSWDQLISNLTHPTLSRSTTSLTSSMIFIARSNHSNIDSLIRNSQTVDRKLKQAYNTVDWNPYPVDFWFSHEQRLKDKKFGTVLANSSMVGEYAEGVHQRAAVMFKEKAYLHWYKKYKCEENVFREAFENVQRIVDNYNSM